MSTDLDPGRLLYEARTRAGLTQRELARRARTAQSVVARIEAGHTSPTVGTLVRLLDAAGFEPRIELAPRPAADSHMLEDVARFEVFGVDLLAADLADILRSKGAADRPQDRQDVIVLRELLRRRE